MVSAASIAGAVMVAFSLPALGLAAIGWRNREKPGGRGYVITSVGIGGWSAIVGTEIAIQGTRAVRLSNDLELIFVNLTALGWILLVTEYRRRRRISFRSPPALVLYSIPIITMLLTATNGYHNLVWAADATVAPTGRFRPAYGAWFWVHTTYVIGLHVGGAALFARDALVAAGIHRRQLVRMLLAWIIGFGMATSGFAIQAFGLPVPDYIDPAPPGFLLASVVWGLTLFRDQLFRVVPVGRERAVETMSDAIVSVNADGKVADANPAARDLFGDDVIGTPVEEMLAGFPDVAAHYREVEARLDAGEEEAANAEVSTVVDGVSRHFSVTITPIDYGGGHQGRVLVLRDVTDLKNREQELDLLRQILSRILRHNVRNSLSVIVSNARYIETEGSQKTADQAATIVDQTERLTAISNKAKTIAEVVERDRTFRYDLTALVERTVADMSEAYPEATVTVDVPESCAVVASGGLEAAVANLVENAIVHHDGTEPVVTVTVERNRDTVELVVTDDGPGIPQQELDVLRAEAETDLEHGTGVGLWLVQWVAEHSGADVDFETGSEGTTVTLTLQTPSESSGFGPG